MATGSLGEIVIKKTLPNGLTVLLKQDRSTPLVAVNVWFGVGSVHESEEMNGLAHFQEHMVFKGTRKYGVGEIARLVKAAGGNLNAGTSYSYTMYHVVLPADSFDTALEVQADAVMNSTFDPDEFQKERLVVIDEARMYDDRPESFTFYRTMELGFRRHNYRRPIAGYQPIVEKITREQLLEFYGNYYRPANAVLVVVGDVDPDAAFERIAQVYGSWESREVRFGESPEEPPQETLRFRSYTATIDHGYLSAGFHVPNILHADCPALEMISELLSSGRSSRLYRTVLEEKRLVTSVGTAVLTEKWPGFLLLTASMPPTKWMAAAEAIFAEVERFKAEPVPETELEKARRQLERDLYANLETMEGQASDLGYYQLLGDYMLADRHRDAIRAVRPAQIMEVAHKYLHPKNLSVVSYLPAGTAERGENEMRQAAERWLSPGAVTDVTLGPFTRVEPRADGRAAPVSSTRSHEAAIELYRLENGVRVLLKRRTTVPLVCMLTVYQGGSRLDPPGGSGLSSLAHRAIVKGTASYSAEDVVRLIEGAGGNIESYANFDTSGVHVNVLSEHLDEVLPVYREVVRQPLFAAGDVEQQRTKLLEELTKRWDNPIQFAMDNLFRKAFGNHPYAHPFAGDPAEVERLTDEDCRAWYRRVLQPENIVLCFVGDIAPEKTREIAERLYGDLRVGGAPKPEVIASENPDSPGKHILTRKDIKQAVAMVGFLAPPMLTRDALALEVLNGVLTGLGGRLFVELRDKRSLGYMTGSSFSDLFDRSFFFGYANPGAEGVDEAIRVIQDELEKTARGGVTEEELERSKRWSTGTQLMQLQRNFAQAAAYGAYEVLGFGYDVVDRTPKLIGKITNEDVTAAAARVFRRDRAVIVELLPEA
jgi:zinc protease